MIEMETEEKKNLNISANRKSFCCATYCEMNKRSISSASMRSTKGKASIPERPGWIPQSNMILRSKNVRMCCNQVVMLPESFSKEFYMFWPLNSSMMQLLPTSWPAPSGLMMSRSLSSPGMSVFRLLAIIKKSEFSFLFCRILFTECKF